MGNLFSNHDQEHEQRMFEKRQYEDNLRHHQQLKAAAAAAAECRRQREREEEQERQRQRHEADRILRQAKLQAAQRLRNAILDAHYPPLGLQHHHSQVKSQNHNYHVGGTWYDDDDDGHLTWADNDRAGDPDWVPSVRWENGSRVTQDEDEGYTGSDGYFRLRNQKNNTQQSPHYLQQTGHKTSKTSSTFAPRQKKGRKGRGDLYQDDYHAGFSKSEIQAMSSERKAEYEVRKLKRQMHETTVASH
ncbi:hypothetical protein BGZ95_010562 [Linnemannia exigua]|uniref:Uncharacterized protein n=1 Tax=Linnemannia exigua TaxID=604196 RepID=A0AAD4DBT2_9FUNG|nr:hypothetical protein BGZ95_010562 [Linnemannia exigua]